MNVLVLGGGGREHSLCWAIKQNPRCDTLYCAPGNAGIAEVAICRELDICDRIQVSEFCKWKDIEFVVVGPEAPLAHGISDALRSDGFLVFGPGQAAASLETSKAFTKGICDSAGISTARYAVFDDPEKARAHVRECELPVVVKDDGLAAGKGVTVARSATEAIEAIDSIFDKQDAVRNAPSAVVVIEEFLAGEEASFFVLTDGETVLPFGTARDYKRAYDGDSGPNTGGMGALSPAPAMTTEVVQRALDDIVHPTLDELRRRGIRFQGVLYAGLMIQNGRPSLLEYNVRFGDPECQVLMIRLGAQAFDAMHACAKGTLQDARVNWAPDHAITVVMATRGYPGRVVNGSAIKGLDSMSATSSFRVFHAATARSRDGLTATGGRVLNVTARSDSAPGARRTVYESIGQIDWQQGFFRCDIGK